MACDLNAGGGVSAVGKGKHTRTEMLSLYASKDTGPVCCLVAGALAPCFTTDLTWAHLFGMGLERPSNNELARAFGAKGLERLSLDDFRKDYQFLLRPDHPIAKYADQVVAALGTLSDEDLAVLLQQTPPEHARYMAQGLRVLHQQRGRSAVAVLPDMLDAMWQSGLQEQVKAALKRLTTDGSLWIKSEEPSNVSPSK